MPITSFDTTNLKIVRADLDAALKSVAEKHGMKLSVGNIKYSSDNFKVSLIGLIGEAAGASDDTGREVKWRREYLRQAIYLFNELDHLEGKVPNLDTKLTFRGAEYTIVGARPRAANPIVLKKVLGGKLIAVSTADVMSALKRG